MTVYLQKTRIPGYGSGWKITTGGNRPLEGTFLGYTRKEAIQRFRRNFNLQGRHLQIEEWTDGFPFVLR